jgi:hypothetical protein
MNNEQRKMKNAKCPPSAIPHFSLFIVHFPFPRAACFPRRPDDNGHQHG